MKYVLLILMLVLSTAAFPYANPLNFSAPVVVSVTGTSALALAANAQRGYLIIVNTGSNTVYVKFGSAQVGHEGIPIPMGGSYEPIQPPANSIYIATATSTSSVTIVQGQ